MHHRIETRVCNFFWARPASFGQAGLISNPLIVLKFHNKTHWGLNLEVICKILTELRPFFDYG